MKLGFQFNFKHLIMVGLVTIQATVASATGGITNERLGCSVFDRGGELHEVYGLNLSQAASGLMSIAIERTAYYVEPLIYRRGTNELLGSSVRVPASPFPQFEDWEKQCRKSPLRSCRTEDYSQEKSRHENDKRWTLYPHDIKADHPEFFVLNSNFTVVEKLATGLTKVGVSGPYVDYRSTSDTLLKRFVYISNAQHTNHLMERFTNVARVIFLDNPRSYSLRIQRQIGDRESDIFTTAVLCNK
jgi:hypothetical protein